MSPTIIDGVGYQGNKVVTSNTSVPRELYIQSVVNGYNITSFNEKVFENNINLIKITLPNTISNINGTTLVGPSGEKNSLVCHQFRYCSNVEYIDLSETTISRLGAQCMAFCSNLKDLYLPDTLTTVDHMCFYITGSNTTISLGRSNITTFNNELWFGGANFNTIISRSRDDNLYYKYNQLDGYSFLTAFKGINDPGANKSHWIELPSLLTFEMSSTNLSYGNATISMTFSNSEITETDISNNFNVEPVSAGAISSIEKTNETNWTAIFTPDYGQSLSDCSLNFNYKHYGIDQTINFDIILLYNPFLTYFTITPNGITVENSPAIINMTFSNNNITLVDISNSLTVVPSNAGIIDNISNTTGTNWTAKFTPNYGLDLTDCSLNFNHSTYGINKYSNTFNIETLQQIKSVLLTPKNIITDLSSNLQVVLRFPLGSTQPIITIDPSYIAYLDGSMTSSDDGLTWNGSINRTENMNLLGNTLTVSIDDNSSNIIFDVVEKSELNNKKWNLSNNTIVNKEFTNTLQMSPNGLLMGFIDGSNVEIYRKVDTSYTWNHDISYNGHSFALTNNHIAIASDVSLQIYDYSGNSWNIMNGGNITYSNIIALTINVNGTYVAVSNNSEVKVYKFINNQKWEHSTFDNKNVKGLSLSPNGLKLGMGIGNDGNNFSSIVVEDNLPVDTIPPIITLLGDASMSILKDTTWEEPGYTAIDNFDGYISNNVVITGDVNSYVSGVYTLYYDVSDNAGNSALRKTRTVTVINVVNNVRKIKIENNNYIYLTEIVAYDVNSANVTQGKTATQSSTYESAIDIGPHKLVDGTLDGLDWGNGNHTKNGSNEWVEIDLGSEYSLTKLDLYLVTASGSNSSFLIGATIKLINNSNEIIKSFSIPDDYYTTATDINTNQKVYHVF